ncbi:hypothetical protein TGDOM2_232680 [Toxoplasma gondii GAB2-2007-GAL-DOM2]|uniref:Uncharacterized protein n=6 Tax=Toxoplasma gondii TaxID=5811 RepID=S7V3K1_TOXGG|nr:hypothetical protein TGGT1_232680 [Toxoplasma gondii GT1]KAF4641865.1 hypothetical protein TGRH88_076770 [Toxoplasma gondii]KFG48749.1 hypothetical protein TGDOM2_232680 [Toxoplasma gondii GAB2-2007-GAL-DOM2]KFG51241.1 hypothetical protein TGP89_232680 [Toxoplasma gondii p89]KFG55254.1 hypothetical protein TGFOU_232680 [Toxoplasma gondii FOU]PUA92603.1 hypothetical protein TGBR9_232680 [Toxoplasma gondii TgCATBr9]
MHRTDGPGHMVPMQQGPYRSLHSDEAAHGQQPEAPLQNPNLLPQNPHYLPHGPVDLFARGALHEATAASGRAQPESRQHVTPGADPAFQMCQGTLLGHQEVVSGREIDRRPATGAYRRDQAQPTPEQQYFYEQQRLLASQQQSVALHHAFPGLRGSISASGGHHLHGLVLPQNTGAPSQQVHLTDNHQANNTHVGKGQMYEDAARRRSQAPRRGNPTQPAVYQQLARQTTQTGVGRATSDASASGRATGDGGQIQVEPRDVIALLRQMAEESPEKFQMYRIESDMPAKALHQLLHELEKNQLIKQQEILRRAHALAAQQTQAAAEEKLNPSGPPSQAASKAVRSGGVSGDPQRLPGVALPLSHQQRCRDAPMGGVDSSVPATSWPTDSVQAGDGEEGAASENKAATRAPAHFVSSPNATDLADRGGTSGSAAGFFTHGGVQTARGTQQPRGVDVEPGAGSWGMGMPGVVGTVTKSPAADPAGFPAPSSDTTGSLKPRGPGNPSYEKQMELLLKLLKTPRGSLAIQQLVDAGRVKQDLLQAAMEKYRRQQEAEGSLPGANPGAGLSQAGDSTDRFPRPSKASPEGVDCLRGGDPSLAALPNPHFSDGRAAPASSDSQDADTHQAKRARLDAEPLLGGPRPENSGCREGAAGAQLAPGVSDGDSAFEEGTQDSAAGGSAVRRGRAEATPDSPDNERQGRESDSREQGGQAGRRCEGGGGSVQNVPGDTVQRTQGSGYSAVSLNPSDTSGGNGTASVGLRGPQSSSAGSGTQGAASGVNKGARSRASADSAGGDGGFAASKGPAHNRGSVVGNGFFTVDATRQLVGNNRMNFVRMMRALMSRPPATKHVEPYTWDGAHLAVAVEAPGTGFSDCAGSRRLYIGPNSQSLSDALRSCATRRPPAFAEYPGDPRFHETIARGAESVEPGVGAHLLHRLQERLAAPRGQPFYLRQAQMPLVGQIATRFPAQTGGYRPLREGGRMPGYFLDASGRSVALAGSCPANVAGAGRAEDTRFAPRRRLGKLDSHIQRLVDSAVRRLSGVYGRRFLLRDENAIRDTIKRALKDRIRAMAPSLSALSEYRVDRLFQRLSVRPDSSGAHAVDFDFPEGDGMGDGAFPDLLQDSFPSCTRGRQSAWEGADAGAGSAPATGSGGAGELLQHFSLKQDIDELQAFFMQKESDRQLVDRLRKLQESQRRNRTSRARQRAAPGGDAGAGTGLTVGDDLSRDVVGDPTDTLSALLGGPASGAAVEGAPDPSAWVSMLRSAGPLGSQQWKAQKAKQEQVAAQRRHNVAVAEAKAIEFAKVAQSQRCLLLKVTALDFRAFLHTTTAASLFPAQFRMRQLQLIELLHFDLQAPPVRVARHLLIGHPVPRAPASHPAAPSGASSSTASSVPPSSFSAATAARVAAAAGVRGPSSAPSHTQGGLPLGTRAGQALLPAATNAGTVPGGASRVSGGAPGLGEVRAGQMALPSAKGLAGAGYSDQDQGVKAQPPQSQAGLEGPPAGGKKGASKCARVRVRKKAGTSGGTPSAGSQKGVIAQQKDGAHAPPRAAISEVGQAGTARSGLEQNQESSGVDTAGGIDSLADLFGSGARPEDFVMASNNRRDERAKSGGPQDDTAGDQKKGPGSSLGGAKFKKGSAGQGDTTQRTGGGVSGSAAPGNAGKMSSLNRQAAGFDRQEPPERGADEAPVAEQKRHQEAGPGTAPFFLRPWTAGAAPEGQGGEEFGGGAGGVVIPDLDGEGDDEFI